MTSMAPAMGLSPRVRGNPGVPALRQAARRSIPACAGEPRTPAAPGKQQKVYPRVCGGTQAPDSTRAAADGLSPRVRGNPARPRPAWTSTGSIPACAGEPVLLTWQLPDARVYPRVCGGTLRRPGRCGRQRGLSPRVRGNLTADRNALIPRRSIPACAGEPPSSMPPATSASVYPRVCGGTHPAGGVKGSGDGLSPRVRGNRSAGNIATTLARSIPACAGEPTSVRTGVVLPRVYPRVCGGTGMLHARDRMPRGLSPRVRGNLLVDLNPFRSAGSIPACAGEPDARRLPMSCARVYPRVCGGTLRIYVAGAVNQGLSPRVRGNPPPARHMPRRCRSIPACAGEPPTPAREAYRHRVYPRVCGGTPPPPGASPSAPGLSPRVRGNLGGVGADVAGAGSIPACAGEPPSRCCLLPRP